MTQFTSFQLLILSQAFVTRGTGRLQFSYKQEVVEGWEGVCPGRHHRLLFSLSVSLTPPVEGVLLGGVPRDKVSLAMVRWVT